MAAKCPDIAAWSGRLLEFGEEQARSKGLRRIAYFCSYVPEEILPVPGLYAYRMRAPNVTTTETADSYLGLYNCSYTRSVLQAILAPEPLRVDGFIFTASCDHLRRLYDNLRYAVRPAFCHILGLPYKTHTDARDWFAEELSRLRDALVDQWDLAIDDKGLRKAIQESNENRRLLSSLNELRKKERPPVTGEDVQRIVAASLSVPKTVINPALAELIEQIGLTELEREFRARILLMGAQMDDPEYVRVIEGTGALVVADAYCWGSLHYSNPVGEATDPLSAISRRYLDKMPCPHMFDAYSERYRHVRKTAQEYGVQGIIIQTMKFCDCWGIEANVSANNLRAEGFPVLRLEREYLLPLSHMAYQSCPGTPMGLRIIQRVLKVARGNYDEGRGLVKEEKHRAIMWGAAPAVCPDFFKWMEDHYGTVMIMEMLTYNRHPFVDTSCEESMMRDLVDILSKAPMARHTRGPVENFLGDLFRVYEDFQADMIIMGAHQSCKNTRAVMGILRETCRREGIPLLVIDHDVCDARVMSPEGIKKQVSDFMETVM